MSEEKIRPPEIDKETYNDFRKYCIDQDLETGKALEKAIKMFIGDDDE